MDDQNQTYNSTDHNCPNIPEFSFNRRYFDLVIASVGLTLSTIHLVILIYVRFWQKHKGFFLLLVQAIISVLTMSLLIIGSFIDICTIELNTVWTYFRAYIWVFMVNTLIAVYGFVIVALCRFLKCKLKYPTVLCLDRHVALNNPLYYRLVFSNLRVRLLILFTCIFLAVLVCLRWIIYNQVDDSNEFSVNMDMHSKLWYTIVRIVSTLFQYFISGLVMICISINIITKLKELDRQHFHELRLAEVSRNNWTKQHRVTANICIYLTLCYICFNWPYAIADYFYTDEMESETWYGILEVIINMSQLLYMQLNIFFFAYCSRIYRHNLYLFLTWSVRYLRRTIFCRRGATQIHKNKMYEMRKRVMVQIIGVRKLSESR